MLTSSLVSISRRARARRRVIVCTMLYARIRLRPRHVATFWVPDPWGPFLDLAADRFPSRSYRRSLLTTSLVRRSRRARSPPLSGRSACGLRLPGRVGAARRRPRSSRPMSAAHGFCFQKRSPRVSAHVASQCSHAIRELADSRRNAHFGEPTDGARVLSSPAADPVGVPLMPRRLRALPAELCPPASARHRFRDLRSKPEGLGPLHQAA